MKLEFKKISNAVIVNNTYLIDIPSGAVYYSDTYCGNRNKDFPQYVFSIVDLLRQLKVIG